MAKRVLCTPPAVGVHRPKQEEPNKQEGYQQIPLGSEIYREVPAPLVETCN